MSSSTATVTGPLSIPISASTSANVTVSGSVENVSNEPLVCGPEMITLEQLKMSLEVLKQGGPVSLKESLDVKSSATCCVWNTQK